MSESHRLFYALWPDDATRAALAGLQLATSGKQTRYQNLHITLAFLGKQPASLLPTFTHILAHLPAAPMTLILDRVGYFVRNRIAWAGMHHVPEELTALQKALVRDLTQQQIAFDDRAQFKPHVTLARDSDAPPDLPFEPIVWKVVQIALVKSTTHADGVQYDVLASNWLTPDK
jgi:2'-5' RNA ligase